MCMCTSTESFHDSFNTTHQTQMPCCYLGKYLVCCKDSDVELLPSGTTKHTIWELYLQQQPA